MLYHSHIIHSIKEDLSIKSEFNLRFDLDELFKLWRQTQDSLCGKTFVFEFRPILLSDGCVIREGKIDRSSFKSHHAEHTADIHVKVSAKGLFTFTTYGSDHSHSLADVIEVWAEDTESRAILQRAHHPVIHETIQDMFDLMTWMTKVIDTTRERENAVNRVANMLLPAEYPYSICDSTRISVAIKLGHVLVEKYAFRTDCAFQDIHKIQTLIKEVSEINATCIEDIISTYNLDEEEEEDIVEPSTIAYKNHGFIYERSLNTASQSSQIEVNLDCIFDDDEEF